jgi:hypothetical protein
MVEKLDYMALIPGHWAFNYLKYPVRHVLTIGNRKQTAKMYTKSESWGSNGMFTNQNEKKTGTTVSAIKIKHKMVNGLKRLHNNSNDNTT